MTERSRFWGGTTIGDATVAPYDAETEFAQVLMSLSEANGITTDRSCVFRDELAKLIVTGAASPVAVGTGRALVYGTWYENDAGVNVAIPTPAASTRIDRIVLRKDWVAQTVRITRIAGVEGGGAPAITQTAGVTWDMPVAQVSITTGGVITITDERDFIPRFHAAQATHSVGQTVTHNVELIVALNTDRFDSDNFHDVVTNNSRLTVPTGLDGVYLIVAQATIAGAASGQRIINITQNGTQIARMIYAGTASFAAHMQCSTIRNLVAGDFIDMRVFQDSGVNQTLFGQDTVQYTPVLAMYRLGQL